MGSAVDVSTGKLVAMVTTGLFQLWHSTLCKYSQYLHWKRISTNPI